MIAQFSGSVKAETDLPKRESGGEKGAKFDMFYGRGGEEILKNPDLGLP